jgi:hypothetical protein
LSSSDTIRFQDTLQYGLATIESTTYYCRRHAVNNIVRTNPVKTSVLYGNVASSQANHAAYANGITIYASRSRRTGYRQFGNYPGAHSIRCPPGRTCLIYASFLRNGNSGRWNYQGTAASSPRRGLMQAHELTTVKVPDMEEPVRRLTRYCHKYHDGHRGAVRRDRAWGVLSGEAGRSDGVGPARL